MQVLREELGIRHVESSEQGPVCCACTGLLWGRERSGLEPGLGDGGWCVCRRLWGWREGRRA